MKLAGIVAEYNPFHNGHLYQINQTKLSGATHIVAVMSGHFVQRGDIAICSKWERARACLLNGVDLVVELPTMYALASANTFAEAAVYLLNQMNVDRLSFGSESGDIALLKRSAELMDEVETSNEMTAYLMKGMSYPTAREKAMTALFGKQYADVISSPNNVLGIEYLRAIQKINPNIVPVTIKREQAQHDSNVSGETISSASNIREILLNSKINAVEQFIPPTAFEVVKAQVGQGLAPVSQVNVEQAMLYQLRNMTAEDFAKLPDVCEGLENRLYKSAQTAISVLHFFELTKTKRYTLARIRRIAYCALLGIKKENQAIPPQYIRVLGANQKGMEILRQAKKTEKIPVDTKFASLYEKHPKGIEFDVLATDVFSLATTTVQPCNRDFTSNTVILK